VKPEKDYYYYQMESSNDLSHETFERRQMKLKKSNDRGFVFDLNSSHDQLFERLDFISQKINRDDALLFSENLFTKEFDGLSWILKFSKQVVFIRVKSFSSFQRLKHFLDFENVVLVFQCENISDLIAIISEAKKYPFRDRKRMTILPEMYNTKSGRNISAQDYLKLIKDDPDILLNFYHRKIPFWNHGVDSHFELEPLSEVLWKKNASGPQGKPQLSVIIPTFNNARFLVNVITHLAGQNAKPESYEVIVVDDGSTDGTSEILKKYIHSHNLNINLKFIYWSKSNASRGDQNFFRPGQARNLAAQFAEGEFLFFLDSDMLVPSDFVEICLSELKSCDLIQFQRFHIKQKLSLTNPRYPQVSLDNDCYVEERYYWNQLFNCADWNSLVNPWKFVCTYALGVKQQDFFDLGRIRRHFISYGFEDTDLGFRFYKCQKKFRLIKRPLLHLTNYSQMQYQNSDFKRRELLSKTAKIFFLDHLDLEIGDTLRIFLGGEKNLLELLKDRFLSN
jgi:glycosyltransferase involved in cell wall biosynthesis